MNAGLNERDWELISAYLDSSLTPAESREVEERLEKEPEFNAAFISLRRTRAILRAVPDVKRRRSFYLTPAMAGQKRWTWLIPAFNYSSAAAGLLAAVLLALNLLPTGMRAAPAPQAQMAAPVVQATAVQPAALPMAAPALSPTAAPPAAMKMEQQPVPTQPGVLNNAYSMLPTPLTVPETAAGQGAPPQEAVGGAAHLPESLPTESTEPLSTQSVMEEQAPAPAAPLMAKGSQPVENAAPEINTATGALLTPTSETEVNTPAEVNTQAEAGPPPAPAIPPPPAAAPVPTQVAADAIQAPGELPAITESPLPVNTGTALAPVLPESAAAPAESHARETNQAFSTGRLGGVLLLVSVLLGAAGYIAKKKLR